MLFSRCSLPPGGNDWMKLYRKLIAPLSKIRKILPDGHHVPHPSRDNGPTQLKSSGQLNVIFKAGGK